MTEIALGFLCLIGGLMWAEFKDWLRWLASKLVSWSVKSLPIDMQARMREEWVAEVASIPGKISPLLYALSIWWTYRKSTLVADFGLKMCQPTLRIADIVFSVTALVFILPACIMLLVSSSISCGSFGIRRTISIGRKKVPFSLVRFQIKHKTTGKITPFGDFLIVSGLENLPMFINVLRGEMSVVGPSLFSHGRSAAFRPGLVWYQRAQIERAEDFGVRTAASLKVYFSLIAARLIWAFRKRFE